MKVLLVCVVIKTIIIEIERNYKIISNNKNDNNSNNDD